MEVSKNKKQGAVNGGNGNRYPIGEEDYTTDNESIDSASGSSSEVESSRVRRRNHQHVYTSDGYSSGVPSRVNARASAPKDFRVKAMQNRRLSDDDIASAPPIHDSDMKASQGVGEKLGSRSNPSPADGNTNDISIKKDPDASRNISSAVGADSNTEKTSLDQNERTVGGVKAPVSLSSLPARLPTFHASAQGPWCAVIAYDACVRLCLHLWARGCIEAPVFLENECELLQNAFGLQQVLLQSEDELLAKRSAGLTSEGASLKPKKIIGKMKVQVRKVKMALDPPTGCSALSVKLPIIKTETLRHFTNLSSGCRSLAKVRVAPRIPANGSLSRQSLAYVNASTQYIKQVSGLLKGGVTTLRNTSSSYDDD